MTMAWTDDYQYTDPWLGLSRLTTRTHSTRNQLWDVLAVPKKYCDPNAELDCRIRIVDKEKKAILKELSRIKAIKMSARNRFLQRIRQINLDAFSSKQTGCDVVALHHTTKNNPVRSGRRHPDNMIAGKNARVKFPDDKLITLPVARDRQRGKFYYPDERDHKFHTSVIAKTIDRCVDSSRILIQSKHEEQGVGRTRPGISSSNKVASHRLSHELADRVLRSNWSQLGRNSKVLRPTLLNICPSTLRNSSDCATETNRFGIQTIEVKKSLDTVMSSNQRVPETGVKMDKSSGGAIIQSSDIEPPGGGQAQNPAPRKGSKAAAAGNMTEIIKNASTADRYNPDGSIRTVHTMPDFAKSYGEARKARYIRSKEQKEDERELSAKEIFDRP